jgi:aryl-alcohol dehydrogenase-like predicted oxidoreductase
MALTTLAGKQVSKLCLGTMTWGEQNTEAEAHSQIDYALERGLNFMDTAEMYPVPPTGETYGRTEEFIGSWFAKSGMRDQWVLATKAAGPGRGLDYMRNGPRHTADQLKAAVDASLKRLQTDYIDLYQLHWPDRNTNIFGQLEYRHRDSDETPVDEILQGLSDLVDSGKIRSIGLSNENPWGVMKFVHYAEKLGLPRIETVQNPYSLLNRTYEIGMAEISHREDVGLLAYSPLAFGMLSGKYRNGAQPDNARLTLFERFSRYTNEPSISATEKYCQLAEANGLDPAQMALAFVSSRSFLLSNIIGATSLEQLESNINSSELVLDKELLKEIDSIHRAYPNPAP